VPNQFQFKTNFLREMSCAIYRDDEKRREQLLCTPLPSQKNYPAFKGPRNRKPYSGTSVYDCANWLQIRKRANETIVK